MTDHIIRQIPFGPIETPSIKVIFRGLIISSIHPGTDPAMIGALDPAKIKDAACHKPIIHLYEIDTHGVTTERKIDFPLDVDYELTVDGETNIQVFQRDPFTRLPDTGNDKKDFRWFVDLGDLHGFPIKIDQTKLKPRFFLNNAVFHVSDLSDGEVNKGTAPFGKFAMEITARIVLQGDAQAVLRFGKLELRMGGLGDTNRYEIDFDCTCRSEDENESDFGRIYDVITDDKDKPIAPNKRVELKSPSMAPAKQKTSTRKKMKQVPSLDDNRKTPEVYCTGGNCSAC